MGQRLRPYSLVALGSPQCNTPGSTIAVTPQLAFPHNAGKPTLVTLGKPTLLNGGKRLVLKDR
ncbi:hypothetical protein PanNE5_06470 [Pandoraea sp. NE5]|nr:hypothetical protein PanNE5_06470 [Pandoraea sp. NE5]